MSNSLKNNLMKGVICFVLSSFTTEILVLLLGFNLLLVLLVLLSSFLIFWELGKNIQLI